MAFQQQTGRSKRKTLGRYGPTLSLGAAREMARALLADVVRGGDPVADAQTLRHSPTVNSLAAIHDRTCGAKETSR
ncbi:integrase arm-type DNA-binding domain-containing protein [Ruegeria arenilitoris]|uniref:integrase arm-type DNA-binding domain-containing protein n=1 Tax=Ruegeria arenilitoris TaxID=1173585 RepID=UPI00346448A0